MPLSWLDYKGKKMLYIDMRNTTNKEMLAVTEEEKKIINESSTSVLLLVDFRETLVTKEYMDKAKQYGKEQKTKIRKTALLGIEGIKKILVKAYIQASGNENTKIFDNIEDAKDYLIG